MELQEECNTRVTRRVQRVSPTLIKSTVYIYIKSSRLVRSLWNISRGIGPEAAWGVPRLKSGAPQRQILKSPKGCPGSLFMRIFLRYRLKSVKSLKRA